MQHPGGTCVALPNVDACPQLSCAALTFMYLQQVSVHECVRVYVRERACVRMIVPTRVYISRTCRCVCSRCSWTGEVEWNGITACSYLQGKKKEGGKRGKGGKEEKKKRERLDAWLL